MANRLGLDPKDFKHIKSDAHSTTLQHKNGHMLTINHNVLGPNDKATLKALSNVGGQYQTPLDADETKHQSQAQYGRVIQKAKGGKIDAPTRLQYEPERFPEEDTHSVGSIDKTGNDVHHYGGNKREAINKARDLEKSGHTKVYVTNSKGITVPHYAGGGEVDDGQDIDGQMNVTVQNGKQYKNKPQEESATHKAFRYTKEAITPTYQPKFGYAQGGLAGGTGSDGDPMSKIHEFVKSISASPTKMAEGGEPNKTFLGAEVYGTGIAKSKPQESSNSSAGDNQPWPSPSQTSVGKSVAAKHESGQYQDVPQEANGGEIEVPCKYCGGGKTPTMYAEGDEVVPTPDYANTPLNQIALPKDPESDSVIGRGVTDTPGARMIKNAWQNRPGNGTVFNTPQDQERQKLQAQQPSYDTSNPTEVTPQDVEATKANANVDALQQKTAQAQQDANSADQTAATQAGQQQSDPFSMGQFNNAVTQASGIQNKQLANQVNERRAALQTFQNSFQDLNNERRAHVADIQNGYIDPEKYWDNHSKVAAGIGMILAGFNPTSRPNAAIDFLNNQINRSMDAQKMNLSAKDNLLKANIAQFGNLQAGTLMTNAMLNDTMATQLQQAALGASNPLAKQAALGAAGQLMQQAAQFQRQLAMQQTMMKLANGAGTPGTQEQAIAMMSAVNPEGAKVYRDAFVPGVGMSRSLTPIPEEVRQQIASGQKLQNATMDLLNYSKTHTNLNPLSPEYKVGTTKAMVLQQMVREGMLGTVFRESEKPLLAQFVNENPAGAMKKLSSDPKLKTLLESSINQLNETKKTYGLPTAPQQQPPKQGVNPREGQTGVLNGQRVKMINGKLTPI